MKNVLSRVHRDGIPVFLTELRNHESKADYEQAIVARLEELNPDLIALAGYMKIVGPTLLDRYQGKIINIHPALLPSFPGKDGIGDALKHGVKVLGITIHYVDAGVDTGPIIDQAALHIDPDETGDEIRARVHALEHELYPKVITELLKQV